MISRNRNAQREFEILDTLEAGISLIGSEVKSIKTRGMKLEGAYVKIVGTDIMLINAEIPVYEFSRTDEYDSKRSRRLLLHKKEIVKLITKLSQGSNLTIIPLSCYNKRGLIKIEIALAKGRKTWEKKRVDKEKSEKKRERYEIKEYLKR